MPFEVPKGWMWAMGLDIFKPMKTAFPTGETFNYIDIDAIDNKRNIITAVKVINTNQAPSRASRYTEKGCVLFSMVRPYLRNIAIVLENNCIASTGFFVCHTKNCLLPKFCYYQMLSNYVVDGLNNFIKGDNSPSITKGQIETFLFPIPPREEQKRIVSVIEQWFTLINILEDAKGDLQNLISQAKSKILDLAIHGKLVPQDPTDEPAIELLKRINPGFTPCDNAHDTNQLPNSWCWTTLGDVCELVTGSTPSKLHPEYYGGDFPFYKPTDLDAGRHVNIPSEFLTDEGKNVSRIIPVGSTAICCIGSIGKCGYIEKEGTTNQQINTAVPSKSLSPLYLYYFCNSSYFIDELSADSSAITISIVNKSKLSKMLISLPPYNEQLRIVAKIEELFAVLDEIQKSIEA